MSQKAFTPEVATQKHSERLTAMIISLRESVNAALLNSGGRGETRVSTHGYPPPVAVAVATEFSMLGWLVLRLTSAMVLWRPADLEVQVDEYRTYAMRLVSEPRARCFGRRPKFVAFKVPSPAAAELFVEKWEGPGRAVLIPQYYVYCAGVVIVDDGHNMDCTRIDWESVQELQSKKDW